MKLASGSGRVRVAQDVAGTGKFVLRAVHACTLMCFLYHAIRRTHMANVLYVGTKCHALHHVQHRRMARENSRLGFRLHG